MQTRLTALFQIEKPLFCPGMTYVANADLVAATSNAGGLGILAIGHLTPQATRSEIRRVRELTTKPFAVGCALLMPGARENLEVALEEKVPVVNYSLGSGSDVCERVHAYGGKVIATVVSAKHALSAQKAGVDALLVTGHEAAAHGGSVTSLVLISAIRAVTDLPIIAAGGFSNGQGLIAALALGADGIAMGTRLAATQESPVHAATKDLIVAKQVEETIYNANFDSMPCRVMATPNAKKVMSKRLNPIRAIFRAVQAARQMNRPMFSLVVEVLKKGFANTLKLTFFGGAILQIKKATIEGNHREGIQLIGQAQGLVNDLPTVAVLFDRVMLEAEQAANRIHTLHNVTGSSSHGDGANRAAA